MTNEPRRTSKRDQAYIKRADHAALWALIGGAVVDAMRSHPNYFTERGLQNAARSITKRAVGQLVGAIKTPRGGRESDCLDRDGWNPVGPIRCAAEADAANGGAGRRIPAPHHEAVA